MSDLLREAVEISRNHRTSSLDPSGHPVQIVKSDVCESCGDALTKEDIAFHSVPNPATRRHELYCRECSDVVRAIRRARDREV
jgi:hypothetical protein